MLAIMSAAASAAPETTLVFDEVDAGIGGRTANAVGARLRELGDARSGDLHHPPAADRLARARGTSRSSRTPAPSRPAPRSSSSPSARWSASSCGCSAPTATTSPRAATRATCAAPPERSARGTRPAARTCGSGRARAGAARPERSIRAREQCVLARARGDWRPAARYPRMWMAATRPSLAGPSAAGTVAAPAGGAPVTAAVAGLGPAGAAHEAARQAPRAGRHRARRPPRHRPRLRRGADRRRGGRGAQLPALLERRLPQPRPAAARRSRHHARRPPRRRAVRTRLRRRSAGRAPGCSAATAAPTPRCCAAGELLASGETLDLPRVRAETEARRLEVGQALERFAANTIEHMLEERELLTGRIAPAALRNRVPRPLDAARRARRRPPARPARAAALHPRPATADRRGRRRRRRRARSGARARHDRRRHGLRRRARAALRRRAGRALLSRRPRARAATASRSWGCPSSSCLRRAPARTWRC